MSATPQPGSDASYQAGALIGGRYRLTRMLGEGGMGFVFLATDEQLDRQVAVKLIRHASRSEELIERLEREARATARLGHPNIVPMLDFGHLPGEPPFLVMQYLEGEPLDAIIRSAPLDVSRAVDLHVQVLDALAAAHEAGVVHRDLKPANVFVTRLGSGREMVRLLDFGLAYLLEDSAKKLTKQGISLGTPAYMAPERVLGDPTDLRCDIYAVGVTLFEALTGEPPFPDRRISVLQGQILVVEAPDVRTRRPDVPAAVAALIARALRKKANDRFASAREMQEALLKASATIGEEISGLRQSRDARSTAILGSIEGGHDSTGPLVAPAPTVPDIASPVSAPRETDRTVPWIEPSPSPAARASGEPHAATAAAPGEPAPPKRVVTGATVPAKVRWPEPAAREVDRRHTPRSDRPSRASRSVRSFTLAMGTVFVLGAAVAIGALVVARWLMPEPAPRVVMPPAPAATPAADPPAEIESSTAAPSPAEPSAVVDPVEPGAVEAAAPDLAAPDPGVADPSVATPPTPVAAPRRSEPVEVRRPVHRVSPPPTPPAPPARAPAPRPTSVEVLEPEW